MKKFNENSSDLAASLRALETKGLATASEPITFLHKFQCRDCGLHYIVCSEHANWAEATDAFHACPECGDYGNKIHWVEASQQCIYTIVPGNASLVKN